MCILIQHFSVRPRLANINKIGCVLKHARRRRKILAFLDFKTSISIAKTQFQYDFAPQNAKKPALCAEFCARCLFGMFISPSPDAVGRSGRVTRTQDSIAAALSNWLLLVTTTTVGVDILSKYHPIPQVGMVWRGLDSWERRILKMYSRYVNKAPPP